MKKFFDRLKLFALVFAVTTGLGTLAIYFLLAAMMFITLSFPPDGAMDAAFMVQRMIMVFAVFIGFIVSAGYDAEEEGW